MYQGILEIWSVRCEKQKSFIASNTLLKESKLEKLKDS